MSQKLTKSYIHVPEKTPFSGNSIGQRFNEVANQNPDKEMYVFYADKERKTFRQMQEECQQFTGGLLKLGLKKGDTLGIWGGNHYEWLLAHLASLQMGVITVNMRMDFPLSVQQEVIQRLGLKVVVLMRSPSDMCDRGSQVIPELLTNSANSLNCQITPSLKYVINAGTNHCKGMISLTDFMEMGKGFDRRTVTNAIDRVDFDDPISVTFTSGSTGFPKGVTHTHRSLLMDAECCLRLEEDADGNPLHFTCRYALIMSLGSMSAQMGALMPMMKGGTTIIVGPTYDVQLLANVIQDERITGSMMVIHHLNDILSLPNFDDYDFSSFQACMAGGSIIPHSLRQRATKLTKHLLLRYGGTEGFGFLQSPKDPIEILHSPAYGPLDGSEVKIIGDDGQILPINEIGEICVRSRSLFLYYWGEEEKTKAAKKPNGWYHTGDIGTLDENGYLRFVGRKADCIIKEGNNIAPGNLEKVLDEHPAVSNVMVVGVPDKRTLEEVCACIRLHPSAKVTSDELKEFCRGKVFDFVVPKYILFVEDAFPTTETGKFDRTKIAEQAKTILGLQDSL
ncbi:medium-chain acyl-CoA ligase ACSF2, mitochondrial-like [Amphiura filiformis]|uniref:medium-chain acyl-CoA ligase ACSF2, mitochondrial-like n=1 Tax=Amphiura filiformis TaxID=82378 RepID=UPI003B218A2F